MVGKVRRSVRVCASADASARRPYQTSAPKRELDAALRYRNAARNSRYSEGLAANASRPALTHSRSRDQGNCVIFNVFLARRLTCQVWRRSLAGSRFNETDIKGSINEIVLFF